MSREGSHWAAAIDAETTDECLALNGLRWRLPDDPLDFAAYDGLEEKFCLSAKGKWLIERTLHTHSGPIIEARSLFD